MKTLVLGASLKEERYSNMAIKMLLKYDHEVYAYGLRKGNVGACSIESTLVPLEGIDTVTLYINPAHQVELYDYIIKLRPRRVIFNPGTENTDFYKKLDFNQISHEESCTLVLLRTGQY